MSIEKIHHSLYFHPLPLVSSSNLFKVIKSLLNLNESLIFYQPRTEEDKNFVSQGGIEGSITLVVLFQSECQKFIIPFYCSKDQKYFSLFFLGLDKVSKPVEDLNVFSKRYKEYLIQTKKSEISYSFINLVETEPEPLKNIKVLSTEELESIIESINADASLDNLQVQKEVFPKKLLEKEKEQIIFGKVLNITPVKNLNVYVIKTENAFARIRESELLALKNYSLTMTAKKLNEENSSAITTAVTTTTTTTAVTMVATAITSEMIVDNPEKDFVAASYQPVLAKEASNKRKLDEILNLSEGEVPSQRIRSLPPTPTPTSTSDT